jgi:hypothetical protein
MKFGKGMDGAKAQVYLPSDPMVGTAHNPLDELRVSTDFSKWDPQKVWNVALADLGKWSAAATTAGGPWKDLHRLMTGHPAPGDPTPPPPKNLSDLLDKIVDPLLGDQSAWVGQAPTKFREAIDQVRKFAGDLDLRASAPDTKQTSMATVCDALATQMKIVHDRLATNLFANGGTSWKDTRENKRDDFLKFDTAGWGDWARKQTLTYSVQYGGTDTLNGRDWELAAVGRPGWWEWWCMYYSSGDTGVQFAQKMMDAKQTWLTESQRLLFLEAANYLKQLYSTMYTYMPVVPSPEGVPGTNPNWPGGGLPSVSSVPMPEMPTFDVGDTPSPGSVLGSDLDASGLSPAFDAGDVVPADPGLFDTAGAGDALSGVVGSGADIPTETAGFSPVDFGSTSGAIGALTPGSAAGAFGSGGAGISGGGRLGSLGTGGAIGTGGAFGTGAGAGMGVGGRAGAGVAGLPGAAGTGAAGTAGGTGVPPMMPMHPGVRGRGEQEGQGNNLEDDDFFAYDAECTDAVVGERAPDTTQGGREESSGFSPFAR